MASNDLTRITVYPRVHLSLLDLSAGGYRKNGGIGFAVDSPLTTLEFKRSGAVDLSRLLNYGFSSTFVSEIEQRIARCSRAHGIHDAISLETITPFQLHQGFGAGTAISLACIEAAFLVNRVDVTRDYLIRMSGRGGASGIGIATYFDGGLVCDVGRKADSSPFLPSDAVRQPCELPLMLVGRSMPDWEIGVVVPKTETASSIEIEEDFFSKVCPLSLAEVQDAVYHSIFGIAAAAMSSDFAQFCAAVNALQKCTWKNAEIARYGSQVSNLMRDLRDLGCDAVGMSSFGPALFFLSAEFEEVFQKVKQRYEREVVLRTRPRNSGREVFLA